MLKLSIVYFTVDIVSSQTLNLNNVDRGKQVILLLFEGNVEENCKSGSYFRNAA